MRNQPQLLPWFELERLEANSPRSMDTTAEQWTTQGYEQLAQENYPEALTHFERALAINDTHPESLYGRARARFKLEQFAAAIEDFDRLINLIPKNATYFSERGVARHLAHDNRGALEDFDEGVMLEPDNPYRYSSRAYIKDRMQNYQGAIDDYTRAIELDPEDAIAYNNRGMVEEKLGHQQRAQRSFAQADALQPGSTKVTLPPPPTKLPKVPSAKPRSADYLRTMGSVFTSKERFRDFVAFLRGKNMSNQ